MYIPRLNEETRLPVLHDLIRSHSFATLVTWGSSGLLASHIPIFLATYPDDPSHPGTLRMHLARANPQWRAFAPDTDALAIFAGPHHYISASWYPGTQETGREVPTWNYAVVHAYGPLRVSADHLAGPESSPNHAWMTNHLTELTRQHEAASTHPYSVSDVPADYLEQQMRGIVGLELPIRRLEGKWKVSQNRNQRDRDAVLAALSDLNTPESLAMKTLVEDHTPARTKPE